MADTIVTQKTGDVESTLKWLSDLKANPPAEPKKPRPPAPDRNRAATANNARQAQATKRAKHQMTTEEWLDTLPRTGHEHWMHRAMMGGTGVSILIADGDITIYKHTNVRGELDAMGLHKAPNHTKWFEVRTVEDFDAFCFYWMRVRAWARCARVEKPKADPKPEPEPMPIPPAKPDEGGVKPVPPAKPGDETKETPVAPAPKNDGPRRAPAPIRPEVAELVGALEKAGLDKPHAKFGGSFNLPNGYQGYLYKESWKVRNKRTGKSIEVGTVFTGLDRRDILVRELGKIVPVKRAASAA